MIKKEQKSQLDIELTPCKRCNPDKCWNKELCEEIHPKKKFLMMDRFERDLRKARRQKPVKETQG